MARAIGHFLNTPLVQMKNDPAAKDLYQHCEQGIPVKYFSCRYDRKIYQGRPEGNEDTEKPENKAEHMKYFQRRYFTNVIQGLAKM
jgi:hypothetical protein